MKSKIIVTALIISIAVNIVALVAFISFIFQTRFHRDLFECERFDDEAMPPGHGMMMGEGNAMKFASEDTKALRDSLIMTREKLFDLLGQDKPDSVEIEKLTNKMIEYRTMMEKKIMTSMCNQGRKLPQEIRKKMVNRFKDRFKNEPKEHKKPIRRFK